MNGKILKMTRIVVAAVSLALMTAIVILSTADTDTQHVISRVAHIQILPAAMSLSMTVFVSWLIVTLILGRVYCSAVCPMGIFQDICSRSRRLGRNRDRHPYRYSRPLTYTRNLTLALVAVALATGISIIPVLLDPYSIYSRFIFNYVRPLYALATSTAGSVITGATAGIVISGVTMAVIGWLAARNGRTFCNSLCPVGSMLGLISRHAYMRIDINTDRCIQCHKCEHVCKASCIDLTDHVVDGSRCVACFDCLTVCPNDAIHYTPNRHKLSIPMMQRISNGVSRPATSLDTSADNASAPRRIDRRKFLALGIVAAATPTLLRADRAVARVTGGKSPHPRLAVTPPGAPSRQQFLTRCTGCGLCMSHCPTGVLKTSVREYGIIHILHPVMDYDRARCDWDCTACSQVCPTTALLPLTAETKHRTAIGLATVVPENCVHCGRCARSCPVHAIEMLDASRGRLPAVDADVCIGCGTCQNVCPASPYKAIYIEGIE